MNYILLIIGFILLIKGADIFVDGASNIAKKFGIPSIVVGLTIVSLGTSAPELAVSLISSLEGSNGITIGNVLGSNIFNTLMVLGLTSIIMPILIKKSTVIKDYVVNTLVTISLLILTFGRTLFNKEPGLSRLSGIILLMGCIAYTIYLIKSAKDESEDSEKHEEIKIFNSCIANCNCNCHIHDIWIYARYLFITITSIYVTSILVFKLLGAIFIITRSNKQRL